MPSSLGPMMVKTVEAIGQNKDHHHLEHGTVSDISKGSLMVLLKFRGFSTTASRAPIGPPCPLGPAPVPFGNCVRGSRSLRPIPPSKAAIEQFSDRPYIFP